jgi:AhpC/TSA antioxidant enzyme
LQRDRDKFAESGGDLVAIGMGTPPYAQNFREETGFEGRILLSRDKEAYRAFDVKRGSTATVLGPESTLKGLRRSVGLRKQGLAPVKRPQQDWHQLGGAFVIAPGGEITWEHRSRNPADLPDNETVLRELRAAAAGATA